MNKTDEDLGQLEKDTRQLKIEYEQYFGGGRSRPPTDIEWRIEQVIKRYGERGSNMSFGQRFKYSGLAQTYAKYKDIFRKRMKQREEGAVPRHFGAAAKAIAAERAAKKTESGREVATATFISASDPGRERVKTKKLYDAFREAKESAGENTRDLTAETFQEFLREKACELRAKSGDGKVEFVVSIENGRARIKARVHSTAPSKA
jgi:hypothetical protein